MSFVETLRTERVARLARFAKAAETPKITKPKPAAVQCPVRPYTLAKLAVANAKRPLPPRRMFDPQDELAWMVAIEGYVPLADVPIRRVQEAVCQHMGVTLTEMLSDTRVPTIVRARHMAVYLCRRLFNKSYPVLGLAFRKDHSTQIYAYRQGAEMVERDERFRASVEMLTDKLGGDPP